MSETDWSGRRSGPRFNETVMTAFEVLQDLVAICRHGVVEAINGAGVRLLGALSTNEIIGLPFEDVVDRHYRDVVRQLFSLSVIEIVPIPVKMLCRDGQVRQVDLLIHPARELGDGCTLAIAHDTSRVTRLAQDAWEREGRFRALVENAMHLICECRGETIAYMNPAGAQMLGAKGPEELKGALVCDMFSGVYRDVICDSLIEVMAEKAVLPVQLKRHDGTIIDAQIFVTGLPGAGRDKEYMIEARDITAHNRAVAALRQMNQTLEKRVAERTHELEKAKNFVESLMLALPAPVWWRGVDGRMIGCNQSFEDFLGKDPALAWRQGIDAALAAEVQTREIEADRRVLAGAQHVQYEVRMPAIRGLRDVIVNKTLWRSHDGEIAGLIGCLTDISERKAMETELRRLATTDPLTGIYNRRHFMTVAEDEAERARRYKRPLCGLMFDIDHFKAINDGYGHPVGDEVIRAVARCSQTCLRSDASLGRLGGEEFGIVLPETTLEIAMSIAERLREMIEGLEIESVPNTVRCTVSVGVAQLRPGDISITHLITRADHALYRAKRQGRNRVEADDDASLDRDALAMEP